MIKIAHISDVHMRNLKYHDEYRKTFENLYSDLRENVRPDIIANTGDTAHTKTQISPEFVGMGAEHIRKTAEIAPYHLILGNHDLNLMNPDRQDAISPIVESLHGNTKHPVHLYKKSGKYKIKEHVFFFVFSLADAENYPSIIETSTREHPDDIHIGLFHGSITNCLTDQGWQMTNAEHDLTVFGGCDYVLMGDIHKRQFFGPDRRIGYPGSLIQQNFGEDPTKGYLVWNIESRTKHTVFFRAVEGSRKFFTIRLNDDTSIPEMKIPEDSRVRIVSPRNLSLVEQKNIEREVRNRFSPKDVISITSPDTSFVKRTLLPSNSDIENIRSLSVQDKLIRKFLKGKVLDDGVIEKIAEINKKYQVDIENREDVTRNVFWKVKKLGWTNMFNYGEDNWIDFTKIPGLTGIFAPNTAGKSSIFEIFMESLFDKVTKDVSKNIELINDNRDEAKMVVELQVGDQDFIIERNIERIKYGQRKMENKETGKMALDFYKDVDGEKLSLNGTIRSETERTIRRAIGTFEDFVLTTISSQEPIAGLPGGANLIMCKETDRKKILFRFLDLDIFDMKAAMAKEESKDVFARYKELEGFDLNTSINEFVNRINQSEAEAEILFKKMEETLATTLKIDDQITELHEQLIRTDKKIEAVDVNDTAAELRRLDRKITTNGLNREELSISSQKFAQEINALGSSLALVDFKLVECTLDALREVRHDIKMQTTFLTSLKTKIQNDKKKIKLLDTVPCGNSFPSCRFIADAFESKLASVSDIDQEIIHLVKLQTLQDTEMTLVWAEKTKDEITEKERLVQLNKRHALEIEKQLVVNDRELMELNKTRDETSQALQAFQEAEASIIKNEETTRAIRGLQKKKQELTKEDSLRNKQMGDLNKRLGADNAVLERFQNSMKEFCDLKLTCDAYENYIETMGKHGIAYQILAEKLPIINDEINKILSNVVNFSVFLEHDETEQTIRLYLQYGDYRSRNLGLSSGAEKFIASLAIRAALLNVSNLPKTNMFIVDEGFGKLDPSHLESIQRMFDYLRSVFDHVIVISHVDTLKDMVDNSIEISSDIDGYAHVEVV